MRCGIADSAGDPAVVESEDLSAFAVQDLTVRERAAVKVLIVIGLAPLLCVDEVIPLQLWWIDFWQVQHITTFAIVDFLQTPHCRAGPEFVSTSPAFRRSWRRRYWGDICGEVGDMGWLEVSALVSGCLGLRAGKSKEGEKKPLHCDRRVFVLPDTA